MRASPRSEHVVEECDGVGELVYIVSLNVKYGFAANRVIFDCLICV